MRLPTVEGQGVQVLEATDSHQEILHMDYYDYDSEEYDYEDSDFGGYSDQEDEGTDEEDTESRDCILERTKCSLTAAFPFQHSPDGSRSDYAFIREAEKCLTDVCKHEAILEFMVTISEELDKQHLCRIILDLCNDPQRPQLLQTRITNKYTNHVLVCILQYLFDACSAKEWMKYIMDMVDRARAAHLDLRVLEKSVIQEKIKKLKPHQIYPQRPDQPTCDFYMGRGHCGRGDQCRFHHPKERQLGRELEETKDKDDEDDRVFDTIVLCREVLLLLEGDVDPSVLHALEKSDAGGGGGDADSPFAELVKPKSRRKAHAAAPRPDNAPLRHGLSRLDVRVDLAGVLTDPAQRASARNQVLRLQQECIAEFLPALGTDRFAALARRAENEASSRARPIPGRARAAPVQPSGQLSATAAVVMGERRGSWPKVSQLERPIDGQLATALHPCARGPEELP
jgi:hypothetical protein